MAVLFVSHSSRDDHLATALEGWLKANGFTDLFIDHQNIAGGDNWRRALEASAGSARVVLFLVTDNWLNSLECYTEFRVASYMGKRKIPLFLHSPEDALAEDAKRRLNEVRGEDHGIFLKLQPDGTLDLNADPEAADSLKNGLRAAGALARVGLDPEAFEIDRSIRPSPFPGLECFHDHDADAAIFFGRSREIAHVLEDLRKMRAERDRRPLVILGASGAGKSSLLKAGIIPRLRRESPAWLPLRAFRPGADPLLNFAEALSRSLADFGKSEAHGVIRDRLLAAWSSAEREDNKGLTETGLQVIQSALEEEGKRLRTASNRPGASILISVDQAEELARAEGTSGEAVADYLRAALASEASDWQLAFTIRTDSFPELQRHRRFQDLEARGYDLRALPVFRFNDVVEDPAKRYGVEIDPALIDSLMEESPKEDALPLLAFAMQRLWRQYAQSGSLKEANYRAVGGLTGLIEDAAERALCGLEPEQDVPRPSGGPSKRIEQLAGSTFVPPLAQINDQGATIRRVSKWTDFTEDQQDLLSRFDRWRLVVRKGTDDDGGTVEVAHEALFREWGRLRDWLEPERHRLEGLRSLTVAANAWDRHDRTPGYLTHWDKRLAEACELSVNPRFKDRLGNVEVSYLEASNLAERQAIRRKRRGQAAFGVLLAGLVAGGAGWANRTLVEGEFYRLKYVAMHYRTVFASASERDLKPGKVFQDCTEGSSDCPRMVVVPAGEFMMGSPDGEGNSNEKPQHKVTIAKPFAVGKFEVTFDEWDACVAYGGCSHVSDSGWGRGKRPVINVSWEDAQKYVAWMSKMTGKTYRLLSEAEWEYAARAGTTTKYSWGNEIGKGNANCDGCGGQWDNKQTAPVGSFKPNAFGLHDMHGNVWEWCADIWHDNYQDAPSDGSIWTEGGDPSRRVLRGGSWFFDPGSLRSAGRIRDLPDGRGYSLGFRVGRMLTP